MPWEYCPCVRCVKEQRKHAAHVAHQEWMRRQRQVRVALVWNEEARPWDRTVIGQRFDLIEAGQVVASVFVANGAPRPQVAGWTDWSGA